MTKQLNQQTVSATCILLILLPSMTKAATHWVVTEDGKIHAQEDSVFQMRRPYDLMSFLQQEKRAQTYSKIKSQLMAQKEEIEAENFDNHEDVEELFYKTNSDCLKAKKPLLQLDLYVGTMIFAYPKDDHQALPSKFPTNLFHSQLKMDKSQLDDLYLCSAPKNWNTFSSANTSSKFKFSTDDTYQKATVMNSKTVEKAIPTCNEYPISDFSMTSFEHLPSVRSSKNLRMEAEPEILGYLGHWKSYEAFGRDIAEGLKLNSSSWILYTLASFYWRGRGRAPEAIECVRRALHSSPYEYRPIPLLSLATILHRARSYDEAVIVLHGVTDMAPEIPHSHYTLANIYTVMTDYNKSVICLENVSKLCPNFKEAKLRKHAVLCHNSIENALKVQHENLQKTLDELKDYQRQQELWFTYHNKLRSEQAPISVQVEQRLHYREFKIKQKLEDELANSRSKNVGLKETQKLFEDSVVKMIQMELKEQGEQLIDLYLGHKAFIEKEQKTKQENTNEGDEDVQNLLSSDDLENGQNDADQDDESNKSESQQECSPSNQRPMLIPVTFVLPPSN